ncbi:MAG: hypothetical protein ACXV2C_00570, partial [Candidatus Bathyarchaeia archaeon]
HTVVKQEYPYGNEHVFTGDKTPYSMDDARMKHYGNKEAAAIAANEETVVEASRALPPGFKNKGWNKSVGSEKKKEYKDKKSTTPGTYISGPPGKETDYVKDKKADKIKEETIDEMWKATQNEKGEHILKHKTGKVSSKTYPSKGEAIDAAVRRNKNSGAFKEDFAGVPGPVTVDKKAVNAECCCPALECPVHTKLKANTKTSVGAMKKVKVGGFETKIVGGGSAVKESRDNGEYKPPGHDDDVKKYKRENQEYKRPGHDDDAKKQKKDNAPMKEDANPNVQPIQTSKPAKQITPPVLGSNNKDLKNKGKAITVGNSAVKEDLLAEISKKLAGSYINRAAYDKAEHRKDAYAMNDGRKGGREKAEKSYKKNSNRSKGIATAVEKLKGSARVNAKEELSQEHIDAVIDEGSRLCDKTSLAKKMKYHKGKMKAEEIGSPKFKHHQRQQHIIKGMLEDTELDEKLDTTIGKDGFIKRQRTNTINNKLKKPVGNKPFVVKKHTKEDLDESVKIDPTVARIAAYMNKEPK